MTNQELLWKYAEGTCETGELQKIEQMLETDSNLQQAYQEVLELHTALGQLSTDKPSVQFTQNVLDNLPELYTANVSDALIAPMWKKLFWGMIAACIAAFAVVLPSTKPASSTSTFAPIVQQISEGIQYVIGQVPNMVLLYTGLTLLSLGLLLLVDQLWSRKSAPALFV